MSWFKKKSVVSEDVARMLQQEKVKMLEESVGVLAKTISKSIEGIGKSMNDRLTLELKAIRNEKDRGVIDGENTSVFAYYFIRKNVTDWKGLNNMIVITISSDELKALNNAQELLLKSGFVIGEWEILISQRLDVTIKGERIKEQTKSVVTPYESYVSYLMYAKDHFTDTPHEKAVITKIINKIKDKHAIPSR